MDDGSEQPVDLVAVYERAVNAHDVARTARAALRASNATDPTAWARAVAEVRRTAAAVTSTRAALRKVPDSQARSQLDGQRAVNIATGMLMSQLTITPDAALTLLVEASVRSGCTPTDLALSYVEGRRKLPNTY
jgi:AmiR/NasT family two-component response regulator